MWFTDCFEQVVIARPIWLLEMPLLGRPPNESLETPDHLMGDPINVFAEPTPPLGVQWRLHHCPMSMRAFEIDGRGEERSTGTKGEHGGTGGDGSAFAEHLEFDALAGDIAISQQTDDMIPGERPEDLSAR